MGTARIEQGKVDLVETEELELAAAGLFRLPEAPLPKGFWDMPAPCVSDEDVIAAVRAERDEK